MPFFGRFDPHFGAPVPVVSPTSPLSAWLSIGSSFGAFSFSFPLLPRPSPFSLTPVFSFFFGRFGAPLMTGWVGRRFFALRSGGLSVLGICFRGFRPGLGGAQCPFVVSRFFIAAWF